jgi:hypothetical protein
MTELNVRVRVTRYEVTALPDDIVNNRSGFVLTVEWRGRVGGWAIMRKGNCWNRVKRQWDFQGLPSGLAEDWLRDHRFQRVMDALEEAKLLAPLLTVNGWTVEQAIDMERGKEVSRG